MLPRPNIQKRPVAGSTGYQAPEIKHKEIDHSEDFEVLEITMPADFEIGAPPEIVMCTSGATIS